MSRLNLGLATERLPKTSIPVADPPDLVGFDPQQELRNTINRVLGRFHSEGKWTGLLVQAVINAYGENGKRQITLPRHLEGCIRGGKKGLVTTAIQSQWYQYLPGGAGIRHADQKYYGPLQDLGMGYTTFRDIDTAGGLLIETSETEDDYSFLNLRCLDGDGKKVWTEHEGEKVEGYMVNLSETPVVIEGPVSAIYGAIKPVTSGYVSVSYGPYSSSGGAPTGDIIVSGAGTGHANGHYLQSGISNGKPYYEKTGNQDPLILWVQDAWRIYDSIDNEENWYFSTEDVATPDLVTSWDVDQGSSPAPAVIAQAEPSITSSTLIAEYEPGERIASYRRYLVSDGQENVQGIFKRQHVWAYSDNDPLYPDNLEAIKLGLLALNNEEKADIERGQFYMDKAIILLNNDLKEHFSGLEGTAQITPWLTGGLQRVN
jgi:hypothetical protein